MEYVPKDDGCKEHLL